MSTSASFTRTTTTEMGWEDRAKKLDAKRKKMRVQGRGLLTVEPLAISKRLKRMQEAAKSRRGKPR